MVNEGFTLVEKCWGYKCEAFCSRRLLHRGSSTFSPFFFITWLAVVGQVKRRETTVPLPESIRCRCPVWSRAFIRHGELCAALGFYRTQKKLDMYLDHMTISDSPNWRGWKLALPMIHHAIEPPSHPFIYATARCVSWYHRDHLEQVVQRCKWRNGHSRARPKQGSASTISHPFTFYNASFLVHGGFNANLPDKLPILHAPHMIWGFRSVGIIHEGNTGGPMPSLLASKTNQYLVTTSTYRA